MAARISIIIPAYNEEANIARTVRHLLSAPGGSLAEVIVADGGSTDSTVDQAANAGARAVRSPVKGRAGQMNYGASLATGEVLYFVHADTLPPQSYLEDILNTIQQGCNCGSYRTRFDRAHFMLWINAFFTRFDYLFFRGGDQSIFVTRELFSKVGPFREDMRIMEDYDFLKRIRQEGKFRLVPKSTIVSSRKYESNSWLQVQLANLKVVRMYRSGASQQEMIDTYRQALQYRKNAF